MLSALLALTLLAAQQPSGFDPGPNPMLMRHPTVSATSIAFQFAGDLWKVPRAGGEAVRLTSTTGTNSDPFFSPDGSLIAFTGNYDGNTDVYVMPAEGGVPKRLTAHPSPDRAVGWTPDGKSILFSSSMLSNTDHPRLLTVAKDGGLPKPLPLPSGVEGSYSPDGRHIAYVAHDLWDERLEEVPGRTDDDDMDRRSRDLEGARHPPPQLDGPEPDVARRLGVLPDRQGWSGRTQPL